MAAGSECRYAVSTLILERDRSGVTTRRALTWVNRGEDIGAHQSGGYSSPGWIWIAIDPHAITAMTRRHRGGFWHARAAATALWGYARPWNRRLVGLVGSHVH